VDGKVTLLRNARLQEAMLIPIMIKCGLSTECAERRIHLQEGGRHRLVKAKAKPTVVAKQKVKERARVKVKVKVREIVLRLS
jgi:Na+-transporting NADH:ubiquinone oxidoreductase subunit NqrF